MSDVNGMKHITGHGWILALLLLALVVMSGCAYFSPKEPLVNTETNGAGFTPDRFDPPDWPLGP